MKKSLKIFLMVLIPLMIFYGCKDRTELTGPKPISGKADFSSFVSIGNSLTAGYQSSALYESSQLYSPGNLISQQVNTKYVQPLISDPGIGGKIEVVSLDPFITKQEPSSGIPLNLTYAAPYNNLGIPGIVLADVMSAKTTDGSYSKSPFIDIILRNQGTTQFDQAKALHPTMITLWIGNNDVLGYATSGGFNPSEPTDPQTFASLYNLLADGLASTGAKVVVANIPEVSVIPFFTTVGPQFANKINAAGIPQFYFQNHNFQPTVGTTSQLSDYTLLLTLISQSYLAYFGHPSGKFYADHSIPPALFGIDTTKMFGLDPANPIPNALILDASEIQTCNQTTYQYNSTISSVVNRYPSQFALVDINSVLNTVRSSDASGGTNFGGIYFKTTFVEGGLFSLDGVHPTSQGYAIIANEFLKVINNKFDANYQLIDIANIPGSLSFGKTVSLNLFSKGSYLDPKIYEKILF
ncbi:MAG TPA: SGNH/GDSL hydrolase family protein [Ignavibacteriaceae bacterium]|nr:SGNH/GDSL hydrolase family protein [Ignavibacteriaceae bacterium]